MNSITCNNCLLKYRDDVVPRILDCSHSICTECTTTCIQSSAGCPVCKINLTKSNATDYPVNYELMQKNTASTEKYLKKIANSMKKELIENLSKVSIGLQRIENLQIDDNFDAVKTERTLSDLNKMTGLKTKLQGSVTHQRNGYESDEDFIYDIYDRISSNEVFYAVKNIDGEIHYARLSVMNLKNQIVLHAFGSFVQVLGKKINTIMFADLKRILISSISNPMVFLQANEYKFRIKTLNSNLTSQFTKYCTGELGPVYKGSSIKSRSIAGGGGPHYIEVNKFMLDGIDTKGNFEFMFDTPFNNKYGKADIICLSYVDGSFQLIDLQRLGGDFLGQPCFTDCSVVGIMEHQNNLFKESFINYKGGSIINDSGIILDIEKSIH